MSLAGTLAGGVTGTILAQRGAGRREDEAWTRQREREREQRIREDQARKFEHRRETYLDFYVAVKALAKTPTATAMASPSRNCRKAGKMMPSRS
jgi:hypothetical protein